MRIVIPKEIVQNEKRVAATPETVQKLVRAGCEVAVQSGAGSHAFLLDSDFESVGAQVESDPKKLLASGDVVLKVQKPLSERDGSADEIELLKENSVLIAFLYPLLDPDLVERLAARRITAFSMDMIPRIARAQKLDALSSQSNVAGYKAVLMAANALGTMMPMLMTAAGTISPAKVFVIGAGVAGLQAVATAKRLGAVVEAFDTRPAVKEQVESLGARFVDLGFLQAEAEDARGYAKELSDREHAHEQEMIAQHVSAADIVITTALIPGKPAPLLITEEAVQRMKRGSVIVDLAVGGGGNCALTEPGRDVTKHGVTIMGCLNVPSLMALQSSRLYARNVLNLFMEIFREGALHFDLQNEITRDSLITHKGEVVHPRLRSKVA